MKRIVSVLFVMVFAVTSTVLPGIQFALADDPPDELTFTLYSSDPAGIVDPATGVIAANGTITGAPQDLIGGSTVNGTNGTALIDVATSNTLCATGANPCWGKNAIKFNGNNLNSSVTFTPATGLIDGLETTLVYNAEVGNVNYNSEVSALVTYNGGQTDTKVLVASHEFTTANGNYNGQVITKSIGTYVDVESVKIYISAGGGDTFLYSLQFTADLNSATPSPVPSLDPYTLYSSDPAGIVDPATGVIATNGTITGAPQDLVGGSTVNGTNGTALIDVATANTLCATGSNPCWGKNAIKFNGNCLNGSVTYTPASSLVSGRETALVYNAEVGNVNYNSQVSALVTYNGGQTDTKVLVASLEFTTANGNYNGQVVPKTIGTYPNVESVKIYISGGGGDTFIYSVLFTPSNGVAASPIPSPTPTPTPTPSPSPSPSFGTNLALNKTVTVSSTEGTLVGSQAVDGNTGTRWGSAYSDPQWIYVDLGSSYNVNRVVLKWEIAYGSSYAIQTSTDANNWTDRFTTTTGNGATDDITFNAVSARYVRLYGTVRATGYGYSLWEFEVYGNGITPSPSPTSYPYYRYDTMDNANIMLSKSSNIGFYSESVKTDSQRDTPYVSYMARRDSSSAEGNIIYHLEENPIDTITVDAYYYDNVGYAGTASNATGSQRLDAILQYEGVRFYESSNNSTYTQIASGNVQLTKEISPWPGLTVHHVKYALTNLSSATHYFKILYPQLQGVSPLYNWSTRVDNVEFKYASGGTQPIQYSWVNATNYPINRICVVQPTYTANISGDTEIVVCARGFTQLTAKCWKQGSGFGTNQTVATVNLDSRGVGGFTFPASQYPHGPITIVITGTAGTLVDECNLQLYNTVGTSWDEGLSNALTPAQISGLGLSVVYQDDFTNSDLSIAWNNSSKKYCSHKPGYQDFSGIAFKNYEDSNNPFSQVDTYLRIRADQNLNSTGLISSMHQDFKGFAVKAPAYFECKFIAQNAKGTWPAFWTLTNNNSQYSQFDGDCDELDVIEAYGFDSSQSQFSTLVGYENGKHAWNRTPEVHANHSVNMKTLGGNGMWYQGFHTYGILVTSTDTVYYCDNVEVWRQTTMPVSAADYIYFLINFAVGGSSGWPYDLSRYGSKADMYVDWVRVYGLSQNVQVN